MNRFLAMDVGGSHVACAVVGQDAVLARAELAIEDPSSFTRLLPAIEAAFARLNRATGGGAQALAAALPALLDPVRGRVLSTPAGKLEDLVDGACLFRADDKDDIARGASNGHLVAVTPAPRVRAVVNFYGVSDFRTCCVVPTPRRSLTIGSAVSYSTAAFLFCFRQSPMRLMLGSLLSAYTATRTPSFPARRASDCTQP